MKAPDKIYWQKRWKNHETGWDIGYASTPIATYLDQLPNKDLKILIPGCGNAYEAEYALGNGFRNTYVIDIVPEAITNLLRRFPGFPKKNTIIGDFFALKDSFDLILEQTFFCALAPGQRPAYANKVFELLRHGGILAGLLFDDKLFTAPPPFGGNKAEYLTYFQDLFEILHFETATNSIKPRSGREIFIEIQKK